MADNQKQIAIESRNNLIYLAGCRGNIDFSIVSSRFHDFFFTIWPSIFENLFKNLLTLFRKTQLIAILCHFTLLKKNYGSYDFIT